MIEVYKVTTINFLHGDNITVEAKDESEAKQKVLKFIIDHPDRLYVGMQEVETKLDVKLPTNYKYIL
jgi:hypothetical protein